MPAIIGLAGVLVGSLISTGTNYLLAVKKEEAEQAKTERARNAEIKSAGRLVSDQLATVASGAQMLFEEKKLPEKTFRFPLDPWDQNKGVPAREMDIESFGALR